MLVPPIRSKISAGMGVLSSFLFHLMRSISSSIMINSDNPRIPPPSLNRSATTWSRLWIQSGRYLPSESKQRPRSALVVSATGRAAMANPKLTFQDSGRRRGMPSSSETAAYLVCTFVGGVVSANLSAS